MGAATRASAAKPKIAIVCHQYGAQRAAKALHATGIQTVIWLRAHFTHELAHIFSSLLAPLLAEAHREASPSKLAEAAITRGRAILGNAWSAAGCYCSSSTPVTWAAAAQGEEAEGGAVISETLPLLGATNLLPLPEALGALQLLASDVHHPEELVPVTVPIESAASPPSWSPHPQSGPRMTRLALEQDESV